MFFFHPDADWKVEMKLSNKHNRIALTCVTVFLILMLVFIWGNSLMPAKISSAISSFVTKLIGGGAAETNVRKAGHFTEFFLLGAGFGAFFTLKGGKKKDKALYLCLLALFVPLMDETLQMFNDRGPQVKDIWIDIAGYTCGCLLTLLLLSIVKYLAASGKRRD